MRLNLEVEVTDIPEDYEEVVGGREEAEKRIRQEIAWTLGDGIRVTGMHIPFYVGVEVIDRKHQTGGGGF